GYRKRNPRIHTNSTNLDRRRRFVKSVGLVDAERGQPASERESTASYSPDSTHLRISATRQTGNGCVRPEAAMIVQNLSTIRSSYFLSNSRACSTNASWLTVQPAISPPASLSIADTITLGSCATSSAARSQLSSAFWYQL